MSIILLIILIPSIFAYFWFFDVRLFTINPDYGVKKPKVIESTSGYGVSSSHPLAVKVGMDILEKGGNAVDAAIAISYTLSVVELYGSGIGGGGVMLVLENGSDNAIAYDYRETAPLAGGIPPGYTGVPGFVKGMEEVHKDFGTLPMAELIQPAIDFAEQGFNIDSQLNERLTTVMYRLPIQRLPHLYPDGKPLRTNELLKQPDLAKTLTLIQEQGSSAFYEGEISQAILGKVSQFSEKDLKNYSVVKSEAARGKFGDLEVISAPAPVSGPTVIQALQMADILNLKGKKDNEADFIHLSSEILRIAYKDRLNGIADPSFYGSYNKNRLSIEYSRKLANEAVSNTAYFDLNDSVADVEDYGNTTHFVVLDKEGNMVSATNTLGNFFGSGLYVNGFFLNSQLSNFSKSGQGINRFEPGKRPRSFITPTILRNDDYLIGIGSPGGKRIPFIVTQVIFRHFYFGEDLQTAINQPRYYAENNEIYVEDGFSKQTLDELRQRGYTIIHRTDPSFYGSVQTIALDKKQNKIYGGSDPRRNGTWQTSDGDMGTETASQ